MSGPKIAGGVIWLLTFLFGGVGLWAVDRVFESRDVTVAPSPVVEPDERTETIEARHLDRVSLCDGRAVVRVRISERGGRITGVALDHVRAGGGGADEITGFPIELVEGCNLLAPEIVPKTRDDAAARIITTIIK